MSDAPAPWAERPAHLQRFTNKRDGHAYAYYRPPGARKVRLKNAWGTQAMADEVAALAVVRKPKPAPAIGTVLGAIKAYRDSADFVVLSASTQKEYERWLKRFEVTFRDVLLEDVDAGYVLDLRDGWAKRGYRAANLAMQIFKNVCKAPRIRGEIDGDPFALIDKVARPHSLGIANPRWLDDEFEIVLEDALERKRPGFARALALGRWGGFRRQTICKAPRRARIWRENDDGVRERRLYWVTEKRLVLCDRREDPRLTALLERTEKMQPRFGANVSPLTLAYSAFGEGWTPRALDHALERALKPLAKAGKVRGGLTLHGLRHARGVEIAAAGGSDAEIMSQLDHATPRQAADYRKQAERLGLADNAQDRVDAQIIRLQERRKKRGHTGES